MTRMLLVAPAILTIAFATAAARADAPKEGQPRPQPPHGQFDPMRMFERLDADKEGVISLEKLPERMPERLKEMLSKGDADSDGKLTKEEFKAIAEAMRKQFAERRKEAASGDKARPEGRPGRPEGPFGKPEGRPRHGDREATKGGPPYRQGPGAVRPPMPDMKALFARMDRDESGELSLEEFTQGMQRMRQHMMRQPQARGPMGPHGRPPMGPHWRHARFRSPNAPYGWPPKGPSWHGAPGKSPWGPGARQFHAKPFERPDGLRRHDGKRPEARPEGKGPEARPERPRRPDGKGPEARPERPRRPDGKGPEARPERPRRPDGKGPEARPEGPRGPRREKPDAEKPKGEQPVEKPAKEA